MKILLPYFLSLMLILLLGDIPYSALPMLISFLFSLWFLLLVYIVSKIKTFPVKNINFKRPKNLPILFGLYIFCSFVYIDFYTGMDPFTIATNIINGHSNYAYYQEHFSDAVSDFSGIDKLPYIMSGIYVKFFVFVSFVYFRRNILNGYLFIFTLFIYLFIGLSRGTNFEAFELLLMFFFHYFWNGRVRINIRLLLRTLIILFLCFFIFVYFVEERGVLSPCITEDLCSNAHNTIFDRVIILLNGYFGFGFYFNGVFLLNVDVYTLLFGNFSPSWVKFCGPVINCGVNWTPLFSDLISFIGIPFSSLVITSVLYIFFKFRFSQALHSQMLCYWSFLFLISIPIGKFVYISPSNLLMPVVALFVYIARIDRISKCA